MQGYIFIFALLIASDFFVKKMEMNIPGSIIGLIILFVVFCVSGKVAKTIENSSKTLLKYLPLFIIPIGVGIKELFVNFDFKLVLMLLVSVLSLILAVFITVFVIWIIKYFLKRIQNKKLHIQNDNRVERQ